MVVEAYDAELASIAMAAPGGWPEYVADVTVPHLLEYRLSGVLDHVEDLLVIDVQKVIAHANGFKLVVLEVDGVTGIASEIFGVDVAVSSHWDDAGLTESRAYHVNISEQPEARLHGKLQVLGATSSMLEVEAISI